jgi:hypothetical protein
LDHLAPSGGYGGGTFKIDGLEGIVTDSTNLAQEVSDIYEAIKAPLDRTPQGLMGELETRGQWLARSAEILADAQIILDAKRGEIAEAHVGWNIIKHLIEAKCSDEKRLYILSDRLNATLVHQIDEIRTLLSFEKASLPMRGRND